MSFEMTDVPFDNGLTEAHEEMFQLAEEECAELIQAISKVRRHGWNSSQGGKDVNRENLHEEVADVLACIGLLSHNGLIDIDKINKIARLKLDRIKDPGQGRVHFITPRMVP